MMDKTLLEEYIEWLESGFQDYSDDCFDATGVFPKPPPPPQPIKTLNNVLPSRIIALVCDFEGIGQEELENQSNNGKAVMARKLITYCFIYMNLSYSIIGKLLLRNRASMVYYKNSLLNMKDNLMQIRLYEFKKYMGKHNIIIPGFIDWKRNLVKRKIKFK